MQQIDDSIITETYMVPMRDGIELNTLVYLNSSSPRPVVLIRTPYGILLPLIYLFTFYLITGAQNMGQYTNYYNAIGYNAVSQDFRGR